MGRPAGWMQKLTGRWTMRSPGTPSLRSEIERLFWEQIATGITSQQANQEITEYIEIFYNWQRKQKRLGYLLPAQFMQQYYANLLVA